MAPRAARADHQDQQGEAQQHQHGADQAAGQVAFGVLGFFRGQRHAFDRQEEPDGVGNRRPHADITERQEAAGAHGLGDRDVQQVGDGEVRHHRHQEHAQGQGGDGGDDEHQLQRLADPEDVDGDEHDVERQVDHPAADPEQRLAIGADKHRDCRRGDGVFDEDRGPGEKAAPGAEGAAGKTVAAAGGGDHRGQFGQGKAHAQVHGGHQQGGEEHAAPAALGQAEVPAGIVAGDDVGHTQAHQQDPACRAFFQFALLEIVGADFFKVDRRASRLHAGMFARHKGSPVLIVVPGRQTGSVLQGDGVFCLEVVIASVFATGPQG